MAANESPDHSESLGVFSLKAAAWGFLIPILFVLLLIALRVDLPAEDRSRVTRLLALLFAGMEVIALLTGLVAWSSRAGKTGVLLALVLLVSGMIYAGVELKWIGGETPKATEPARTPAVQSPSVPPPSRSRPEPVVAPEPVSPSGESEEPAPAQHPPRRSQGEMFPNVAPRN